MPAQYAHTPTPWRYDIHNGWIEAEGHLYLACVVESGVDPDIDDANAAFIVRAVNSYDAMLAALEQVEAEMRAGFGSSFGETREQVRRAIALASVQP